MSFVSQPQPKTLKSAAPEPKLTRSESAAVKRYLDMVTYCRPHGGKTERAWVNKYIAPLARCADVTEHGVDGIGNHWFIVGGDHGGTMFTAHTDSVHRREGRQQVQYMDGIVSLAPEETDGCLGADDASGCWILSEMIRAGVPGFYVFFRGEECGGIGSQYMAEKTPDMVAGIKRCISFDRRGLSSVITHQGYGRSCSDEFADALAMSLCNDVLLYGPDDTGVFTDSANFVHLIPECTNISVGYDSEHGPRETQDMWHMIHLVRHLVTVDWSALPTVRDPSVVEDDYGYNYYGYGVVKDTLGGALYDMTAEDIDGMDFDTLLEIVIEADPIEITDTLLDLAAQVMRSRYYQ